MKRASAHHRDRGHACIELVVVVPLIAAWILLIVQVGLVFERQMRAIDQAGAEASRRLRAWEEAHRAQGFSRPCLRQMPEPEQRVVVRGAATRIGWGVFRIEHQPEGEVALVDEPICID